MTPHPSYDELLAENARLQRRIDSLEKTVQELQAVIEQLTRRGKRQAAPFSKGPPKEVPQRPGRKAGDDYGTKAHREPPDPTQITETHVVSLPECCPDCGGQALEVSHQDVQYQVDLPQQPIYRQFTIDIGRVSIVARGCRASTRCRVRRRWERPAPNWDRCCKRFWRCCRSNWAWLMANV